MNYFNVTLDKRLFYIMMFFLICSYNDALELVASGKIDVKPLITHNYKIEETKQAFETSRTGAGGAIKVMIHCK